MTATLLVAAALSYPPIDVDLARASPAELARHAGCRVRCTFTVSAPAWAMNGVTCLGAAENRVAYATGATDKDTGDAVTVVGVLKVVRHELPAGGLAGLPGVGWTEYAVVDARAID